MCVFCLSVHDDGRGKESEGDVGDGVGAVCVEIGEEIEEGNVGGAVE